MLRQRGFTLLEVLVALSIMALLTALGWRTLHSLFQTLQYTQTHDRSAQTLHTGLTQWRSDLQAMAYTTGVVPLEWDGKTLFITRRSADRRQWQVVAWSVQSPTAAPDAGAPTTRLHWQRWASDGFQHQPGWKAAWAQAHAWANGSREIAQRSVLISPALQWQVYFYRGNSWSNALSSIGNESLIPDGVRLQLELPSTEAVAGNLTVDWVRPQINPSQTAGATP